MIQVNGYTSAEVQTRAGVSYQTVHAWSRQHAWSVTRVGNANIYDAQDVDAFFAARLRRELMQAAGWTKSAELIWDDLYDRDCPKCEGFAVEKPAKPDETQAVEWLAGEVEVYCEHCGLAPQKEETI